MNRALAWVLVLVTLWACDARPSGVAVPDAVLESAAARARGRTAFLENCALCHGERADGHGPRRSALSGPAADFTNPNWRRGTSPEAVFETIREGLRGTSMAAWPTLSDQQTWELAAYLLSVSEAPRGVAP